MPRLLTLARLLPVIALFAVVTIAGAQDDNRLDNNGFEGEFTTRDRADYVLPASWEGWFTEAPQTEGWMNLPPVAAEYASADPAPHAGAKAALLEKGFATFTAALVQSVSVTEGETLQASAWAFLRTCRLPEGEPVCESSPESGAFARVGIDPNGGTNPYDSDVVWSDNSTPHNTWTQMQVSAAASGDTVTVFLFTTQTWASEINQILWDDAALVLASNAAAPTRAPAAAITDDDSTPEASADDPAPAAPQPTHDPAGAGSVTHVVEEGETLDAIAFAYGVSRQDLMSLNGMTDPRIISIGQRLIIQAAPTPTPAPPTGTPEPTRLTPNTAPTAPVIVVGGGAVAAIDPSRTTATLCVTFFQDANRNRIQEADERALPAGRVVISRETTAVGDHRFAAADLHCFDGLASGAYTALAAPPTGFGLTTADQLRVQLTSAATLYIAFGAAEGVTSAPLLAAAALPVEPLEAGNAPRTRNPLTENIGLIVLSIAGGVLVVGGGIAVGLRRRVLR